MEQSSLNREHLANTPRIYVASLAAYMAVRVHGRWIDADQGTEAIIGRVGDERYACRIVRRSEGNAPCRGVRE